MDSQSDSSYVSTPSSPPLFEYTHNLLNSSTFLLHLIEPVRIYNPPSQPQEFFPAPAGRSEDNNSSEKLRRRLIDALAFICATGRESDSGAAVCIEESIPNSSVTTDGESGGYTLRIANNGWVSEEVLVGVREIMKALETFADGSSSSSPSVIPANLYHHTDAQVYGTIISLHLSKVLYHLSEIREPITLVQEALENHLCAAEDEPQRIQSLSSLTPMESKKLHTWLRTFVGQVIAADEAGERRIPITAVTAAYQVRRSPIFSHLEALCKSVGCQVVGVHMVKLGRYKAACRTLLHACQKWPGMFVGMKVESVPEVEEDLVPSFNGGPPPTREMEIRKILEEISSGDDPAMVEEGVQALLPTISEEQFTTAWASRISSCTGHAEIRLLEFYQEHPECRPISGSTDPTEAGVRYIGMSKKPCYLCQMFIDRHSARYMLGGLEGEKSGTGVKRILDPFWRLRPVGGADYARILDDIREVVEQELKSEVERWVSRGSDEEVLSRERPRGRNRAKGKRVMRVKRKVEPETSSSSNASSFDGGTLLSAGGIASGGVKVAAETSGEVETAPAATVVTQDIASMSEDEAGEGVKLVQTVDEEPANTQEVPEEVPDLILPTADTDFGAEPTAASMGFAPSTSPPPPHLIDDDVEYGVLSPDTETSTGYTSGSAQQSADTSTYSPISPSSADYHSEMHYFEESEFKLLSPIPEEEEEAMVLVNLETVLVRLADLEGKNDTVLGAEDVIREPELPQRARALSDAEQDLLGLDFTLVVAEENEHEAEAEAEAEAETDAEEDEAQHEGSASPISIEDDADVGNFAPGGYIVPEVVEEASSTAPGGYFVIEPTEAATEMSTGGKYYVVAAEQAGVALPGGYLAAEPKMKEVGVFAPGGYLVAEMKGEVEVSTLIAEEKEEASANAELSPGGYLSGTPEALIVTGGYFAVVSVESLQAQTEESVSVEGCVVNGEEKEEKKGEEKEEEKEEEREAVTVEALVQQIESVTLTHGDAGAQDEEADGFDVINIEQERAKARAEERAKAIAKEEERAMKEIAREASQPIAVPSSPEQKVKLLVSVRSVESPPVNQLGSSPSSSTHTTLSTSTTLACISTPTTPRVRYSATSLFSPSLRKASTWAPPTTATTITSFPAITTSLSGDTVIVTMSRPATSSGEVTERKSVDNDIRPSSASTRGWLPKRLMRVVTSPNGFDSSTTTTSMEIPEDGMDGMGTSQRRAVSFSGTRPRPASIAGGEMLSGTAKALMTLKGLHAAHEARLKQKKK